MQRNEVAPAWAGALAGIIAGVVALGVAQLAAGLVRAEAFPVVAVGDWVVDLSPAPLKEFAIRTFGENDKIVLIGGVLLVLALIAAAIGMAARRRPAYGTAGLVAFGAIGLAAVLTRPGAAATDALPTLAGVAAGLWALPWLLRRATPELPPRARSGDPLRTHSADPPRAQPVDPVRVQSADQPGTHSADPLRRPTGTAGDHRDLSGSGHGDDAARVAGDPDNRDRRPDSDEPALGAASGADGSAADPGDRARDAAPDAGAAADAAGGRAGSGGGRPEVMWAPGVSYAFDRRRLLTGAAGGVVAAGAAAFLGRSLSGAREVGAARVSVALPAAADPAAPIPAGADLKINGLSPFVTPNADFYRVDTALIVPQVDPREWTLRVHGLVDRPIEITYDELLKRPLTEADITLACVSNEVGGPYVGNARWLGVRMADVLREAGIRADADMLLSTSDDGFTCGTPVDVVMDGRDALFAVAMNGEVLPVDHGFPVRQVVPGLYGYVSATKWVVDIKVTRFDADEAYWTPRGWAAKGPIKTQSRIDVPKAGATLPVGPGTIAGVAWAQHTGVDAVEVRVDRGAWRQARLARVPGPDTWRQWALDWDATPGDHTIEVRATDAAGRTQTEQRAPVAPDGATGWHTISVHVA